LFERFWEKTKPATDLSPNGMAGCILWTANKPNGYGQICDGTQRQPSLAHRVAWVMAGRKIPDGYQLDHLCRRPSCVNVDHLEPVTCAENVRRGRSARLTIQQVMALRQMAAAGGVSQAAIAGRYGISQSSVSLIARGLRWADTMDHTRGTEG
jgi:hypothetical protein